MSLLSHTHLKLTGRNLTIIINIIILACPLLFRVQYTGGREVLLLLSSTSNLGGRAYIPVFYFWPAALRKEHEQKPSLFSLATFSKVNLDVEMRHLFSSDMVLQCVVHTKEHCRIDAQRPRQLRSGFFFRLS